MKKQHFLLFLACLCSVIMLTGCDTGSNDAPVINANALDSNTYQSSGQTDDQDGNMVVVPSSDIQVVNKTTANPPVEQHAAPRSSSVSSYHEFHHYSSADTNTVNSFVQEKKPSHHETHHNKHRVKVKKTEANKTLTQKTGWPWPAVGSVLVQFSSDHPGIEIQGDLGEPVTAVAAGTVIYSQANVNRYGNMIIIDHGNHVLTAYAYNQTLLVHPGQQVLAGQRIATMGKDPENKAGLYFEVRRNGKPVNPIAYLSQTA